MKMNYHKNVELALTLGFEEVCDEKAYRGKYYINDRLIWIHDIEALKARLNLENNEDLKHLNYDVESYYKYVNYTDEMVDKDLRLELIKAAIYGDSSVLSGKFSLLEHKDILDGMVGLLSEGLGEEVLYDYAHQMQKK